MKILPILVISLLLSASFSVAADKVNKSIVITPDKELSYALGLKIAQQWREEGFSVDPNIVALAINDTQNFGPRRMSIEAGNITIGIEKDRIRQAKEAIWKATRTAARTFMESNKDKADVITTESGLQYVLHNEGEGKSPQSDSVIIVSYTGTSATKRRIFGRIKAPQYGSEFNMDKVIDGWKEGLPLIKEGGKITLYVPAHLAYGRDGVQHRNLYVIEPNDALVFDIELVKVSH
ncbi:MAG: FKBP-type peptidyl-prolyl cis-trans isomerase [Gammaproteobacteria bacterium]|nr:FKBP-type peptidyl-prolyl cis-trans isomerase [Gammaproteobacteria bacterium]